MNPTDPPSSAPPPDGADPTAGPSSSAPASAPPQRPAPGPAPPAAVTPAAAGGPVSPPAGPDEPAEAPPRRRRGCFGTALRWSGYAVAALALYVGWQALTWPEVARLATENPETTAFIERWQRGQRRAGESDRVEWNWVPYNRISPHLKRAVLVGEDIGFFDHDGFERAELEIALREAWEEKKLPRGASTITQQLAKNLWLSPSKNPLRKVKEALLTRQLEEHLGKRRILEIYLNVVELGPGTFGVDAAARRWFRKPAGSLTEGEAAQLAAMLPNPEAWHPGSGDGRYRYRVRLIQRRMNQARFLWRVI